MLRKLCAPYKPSGVFGNFDEGIGAEHAAELGIVEAVNNENFGIKHKGRLDAKTQRFEQKIVTHEFHPLLLRGFV